VRFAVLTLSLLLAGCNAGSEGPTRYPVSGVVTHGGKPVAKGFISFEPDASANNSGPGGGAPIVAGRYRTEMETGVIGGPHKVRIVGYDGIPATMEGETLPDGKSLFAPFETTFDFPKQATEKDFDVPTAGK
jgi:hypothetical protein